MVDCNQFKTMQVTYFQRKPRASGNYSLEAIFADVRARLSGIRCTLRVAPCLSNGVLARLAIMIDAATHQGEVNHVTGDINFAAILLRKSRTVLTILDCFQVDGRRGLGGWLFRKLWFEWPASRSAMITTISEASKKDIVRVTQCDPKKVVVIGVAISDKFRAVNKPFNKDCPRVLQVGTSPNKNIERLANALSRMNVRLVVVGRLSDSQNLALRESRVEFESLVNLTEEALVDEYAKADIVAFASTFEGFGMPILEGNAMGRPVVTGNCSSMPEVAGDAACLVDPLDVTSIRAGFERVIHDENYREQLVRNGFRNAKRFDPDLIAQQYLAVYKRIAERR